MNASFPELFMLVTALSIDAFAACFVYGTDRVRIPPLSALIIAGLSAGILLISLLLGSLAGQLIPQRASSLLCFALLFGLGVLKLFDSSLKTLIRSRGHVSKKLCFSVSGLHFILNIYADPQKANGEDISVLSPWEALSLGIALSLDSAAAGLGAGMMAPSLPLTILLTFLMGGAAVFGGSFLGNLTAKRVKLNLSWLSGLLLICLAVLKLR